MVGAGEQNFDLVQDLMDVVTSMGTRSYGWRPPRSNPVQDAHEVAIQPTPTVLYLLRAGARSEPVRRSLAARGSVPTNGAT